MQVERLGKHDTRGHTFICLKIFLMASDYHQYRITSKTEAAQIERATVHIC